MSRRVAFIACHECQARCELRETKKGLLCYHCTASDCGHQVFSRSKATDRRLAARAVDWDDNQMRAELGAGPKAPPAAPPPPPPAPPGPKTPPPSAVPWWERPLA